MRRVPSLVAAITVFATIAVACGGSEQQPGALTATRLPDVSPSPEAPLAPGVTVAPSDHPTATPFPPRTPVIRRGARATSVPPPTNVPLPTPAPTATVLPVVGTIAALDDPSLANRGFSLAAVPDVLADSESQISGEERVTLWTDFFSDTRIEFEEHGAEVLLCEGGRGLPLRWAELFELVGREINWEIVRSPAERGTGMTMLLTPLDPLLAADRIFPYEYGQPAYTLGLNYESGGPQISRSALASPNANPPALTVVVRDPNCSSNLPG